MTSQTPRSAREQAGDEKQTELRKAIAERMQEETVYCALDHFLSHYFPPMPTDDTLDQVLKGLVEDGVLVPVPKKEAVPQEERYRLLSFRQPPTEIKRSKPKWVENKIFSPLQLLGDSIRKHVNNANDFRLCVVPTKRLDSTVKGCNFQMDACLTDASNPKAVGKLHVADVAMPFEFKIDDSSKVREEVRVRDATYSELFWRHDLTFALREESPSACVVRRTYHER